MKSLGRITLKLAEIEIGERLRVVDEAHAEVLAQSLIETGRMRQPPEVRRQRKGRQTIHTLISGGHRIRAAVLAGWNEVEVEAYEGSDDEARLWEIDENLRRHELNPLDRAIFLAAREEVYLRLHPEAAHGGDRKSSAAKNQVATVATRSFSEDVRERTGLSDRTVRRAVFIASRLSPYIRSRIAGTEIARNQAQLLALAKMPAAEQPAALELLLAPEPQVKTVGAAQRLIAGIPAEKKSAQDAIFDRLTASWDRADAPTRRRFLKWINEQEPARTAPRQREVA